MGNEKTLMRTVTLRVPDDWRGIVDSWAVQVMLKDFSQRRVLSELVVDPHPGRARLSLSLPEFRTDAIPESVFLRRLIASYLPALQSFRSSKRDVPSRRLLGQAHEIEARVAEHKALPAYPRPETYGMQQISRGLNEACNSSAARSVSDLSEASIKVLIVLSVVAILVVVFFFRGKRVNAANVACGAPVPGYQPWNPKVL